MSSEAFVAKWNICDKKKKYVKLQNRTNNALERYNRTMNDKFPTPHPSAINFVNTIEKESRYQVQRLADIRNGIVVPNKLKPTNFGEIPLFTKKFNP